MSLKILKFIPALIEALILSLVKRVDFIFDLRYFSWWKVVVEEGYVKLLPMLIELGGKLVNHLLALSITKNGKRINWIASGCTLFILKVEKYSKNWVIWPIGSLCGNPLNYEF